MKEFNEKLVLVTGAGSGIGRETSLAFARLGARVVLTDINDEGAAQTEAEIEKLGGTATRYLVNVTDAAAMKKDFEARPGITVKRVATPTPDSVDMDLAYASLRDVFTQEDTLKSAGAMV